MRVRADSSTFDADVERVLNKELTFRDNFNAAIVSISVTSGTETRLTNPLRSLPIGIIPLTATSSTGTTLAVLGTGLNLSRTDGFLGVTFNFSATVQGTVSALLLGG